MKSERMKQFDGFNHFGPITARPALPSPHMKCRNCGEPVGRNKKRWLEHQKKLALAIVRLCAAGAWSRKINRDRFDYQTGAE